MTGGQRRPVLLVVHHTTSPTLQELLESVLAGTAAIFLLLGADGDVLDRQPALGFGDGGHAKSFSL